MTALVAPTTDRYPEWAEMVAEFEPGQMHGSGLVEARCDAPSAAELERLVRRFARYADPAATLPSGKVHCDYRWIADAGLIGFIAIRHTLNDFLLDVGGHIGYSVRPSRRRQGHATRALALALDRAGELGLSRVLVTCDVDNAASAAVIEANGGLLEDVRDNSALGSGLGLTRRYWIAVTG
ncbi:MAG: GNAT family N-acetyltransferase [Nocardioides sp.]|uniref:GNAT family N-acetyltransferase n=1 Tax=Nocardioides sp. TaxID=35761 RepID=UPI0039E32265